MVLLKVTNVISGCGKPNPPGIAREPAFGKGNQLSTFLGGVFNQGYAFVDTALEVHEYWGSLHNSSFKFDAHLLFLTSVKTRLLLEAIPKGYAVLPWSIVVRLVKT